MFIDEKIGYLDITKAGSSSTQATHQHTQPHPLFTRYPHAASTWGLSPLGGAITHPAAQPCHCLSPSPFNPFQFVSSTLSPTQRAPLASQVIEKTCEKHRAELVLEPSLEDIVGYDQWARKYAEEVAQKMAPAVAR